jgi:hypothetical protein
VVQPQAMIDKTGSHYRTVRSGGEGRIGTIRVLIQRRLFGVRPPVGALVVATCRSMRTLNRLVTKTRRLAAAGQSGDRSPHSKGLLVCIALCLIPILPRNAVAVVPINPPLLISQETSTRAIAMDSLCFTAEPFASTSPCSWGSDRRTRITLFAIDLSLQPGENLSAVTADAEDADHRHYDLTVEYVGPVARQEWISAVVLRLNENLGDVGDVLVRVSYGGFSSNRVRIGIGHSGGGPPDDQGAGPTPFRPYTISGQVRDNNDQAIDGIEVTLANVSDGSSRTTPTRNGGNFSFADARSGYSFTVTPSITALFVFYPQNIDMLTGNRVLDFRGTRSYSIRGRLTDSSGNGIGGTWLILNGAQYATAITDSAGNYWFGELAAGGNYTVTVQSSYYDFAARNVTNLGGNELVNLIGTLRHYTVSGWVQLGPYRTNDLEVKISGSVVASTRTDTNGIYTFSNLPAGGNYTITTALPYYDFSPVSSTITDLDSDWFPYFFVGTRQTFAISGKLSDQEGNGLSGIAIDLTGAEQRATVSDSTGHYQFAGLQAGYGYTVTPPSTTAYTFTGQSLAELSSNQTLDFTGLRLLQLNGRVRDQSGNGIIGIKVTLTGSESSTSITAPDGSYSLMATATGSYTITPSIAQDYYTFAPASAQFNNLVSAHTTDFTATLAPIPNPSYVLEFDGQPKTVDYGNFWQENVNLGHFFWEFWAMPGSNAGATYMLSDGYGGAHALLFGFASFNTSEPDRYELFGNIFDGVRHDNSFGSDQGPAIGEWGHFAVGWDGQNIITYYNGVPVGKTPFAGPRRTPGPGGGGGRLLIGGSDHNNLVGRIAQVRGYEDTNPREGLPGGVEASFAPQTVFSLEGNLLSYYFRSGGVTVPDLSRGYNGASHGGWVRGSSAGILGDCGGCPPPQFVIDPSAPNFAANTPPAPVSTPSPAAVPSGALVFDSFSRANSTYLFGSHGGLGSTEGGSTGTKVWQTNQPADSPQPFGILNSIAVLLANDAAIAWVQTGSATGGVDVRVDRRQGRWGRGLDTGLGFRVVDADNFFFAYTTTTGGPSGNQLLKVGYYENSQRTDLTTSAAMPSTWTTLRVVTTDVGDVKVYADSTLVYSATNPLMATAAGAGLYNNSSGLGLVNRWDNFTVFNAP